MSSNKLPNHYHASALSKIPLYDSQMEQGLNDLLRSYMQKLIDDGLMLRFRDVKKMNILDTTSFLPLPDNPYGIPRFEAATPEEQEAINKLDFYSCVPCFEKGALKLNRLRYIVFEVLEIEPEKQKIVIQLYDYLKTESSCWQRGVSSIAVIKTADEVDENGARHVKQVEHYGDIDCAKLYTLYSAKELGWTKKQYDQWMNVIVKHAESNAKNMKEKHNTSECERLICAFTVLIARCNAMLEMNKPSRPVKEKSVSGTGQKRSVSYQEGEAPERKIRNVGALRVYSKEIPRKPCLETVITYKTAKWTVRGHIRRYKNGKEVYIKPAVRTRKALKDTNQVTATTIRFKKHIRPEKGKEDL